MHIASFQLCKFLQVGLAIQAAKQRLDAARGKLQPRRRFAFAGRSRAPDQAAGAPAAAAAPCAASVDPAAATALQQREPEGAAEASVAASSAGASDGDVHVVADRSEAHGQPAKQAGASMLGKDEDRGLAEAAAALGDGVLDTDWYAPAFC